MGIAEITRIFINICGKKNTQLKIDKLRHNFAIIITKSAVNKLNICCFIVKNASAYTATQY
jgi:hypothetical protein